MTEFNQDKPEETPQTPTNHEEVKQVKIKPARPVATYVLMGVTIIVYIIQELTSMPNGLDVPLIFMGKINEFILDGEVWRLITPVLLHGSLLHLASNMYALYIIGGRIEPVYGHGRFVLLYLLAAFGGNVLSFVRSPNISVGASTAIFGLLAGEIAILLQNRKYFGSRLQPILLNLGMLLVINLSIAFVPGSRIDIYGHLGGLLAGFIFAMLAGPKWTAKYIGAAYMLVDTREKKDVLLASGLVLVGFCLMAAIPFLK